MLKKSKRNAQITWRTTEAIGVMIRIDRSIVHIYFLIGTCWKPHRASSAVLILLFSKTSVQLSIRGSRWVSGMGAALKRLQSSQYIFDVFGKRTKGLLYSGCVDWIRTAFSSLLFYVFTKHLLRSISGAKRLLADMAYFVFYIDYIMFSIDGY